MGQIVSFFSSTLEIGKSIDAQDNLGVWREAKIKKIQESFLLVEFEKPTVERWIPRKRVAPLNSKQISLSHLEKQNVQSVFQTLGPGDICDAKCPLTGQWYPVRILHIQPFCGTYMVQFPYMTGTVIHILRRSQDWDNLNMAPVYTFTDFAHAQRFLQEFLQQSILNVQSNLQTLTKLLSLPCSSYNERKQCTSDAISLSWKEEKTKESPPHDNVSTAGVEHHNRKSIDDASTHNSKPLPHNFPNQRRHRKPPRPTLNSLGDIFKILSRASHDTECFFIHRLERYDSSQLLSYRDSNRSWSLLHVAAKRKLTRTCEKLISVCGELLFVKDVNGRLPIHIATYEGHLGIVRLFVNECPELLHMKDKQGNSPLHFAFEQKWKRPQIARFLVAMQKLYVTELYKIPSMGNEDL